MSNSCSIAIEFLNNLTCTNANLNEKDTAQITLTSARIGLYEFDKYLSEKKSKIEIIELLSNELTTEIEQGAQIGAYTSFAMKFAKDLINE